MDIIRMTIGIIVSILIVIFIIKLIAKVFENSEVPNFLGFFVKIYKKVKHKQ